MGQERAWKRKHICLYLAGCVIILLGFTGCHIYPQALQTESGIPLFRIQLYPEQIKEARRLLAEGDFDAALAKSEEALQSYPESFGDIALFQIGLIYAHPQNPHADPWKSIEIFQAVKRDYSESNLAVNAAFWVAVLEKSIQQRDRLSLLRAAHDNETAKLVNTIHVLKADRKSQKVRRMTLQKKIASLNTELEKLQNQIERLKAVDIGIEKKKRKSGLK
jgi:hypothetical protein